MNCFLCVKSFFAKIKVLIRKKLPIYCKSKLVRKTIIRSIRGMGYNHIKCYSLSTWKYYSETDFRITFLAKLNGKKYIIKITKGHEEKICNSIKFQLKFNDIFDFIPKGFEIQAEGCVGIVTEYIDSYPFSCVKNLDNINNFLFQANHILDALNQYKVVHCDLVAVNILIAKSNLKLYVIDFDTFYCKELGANGVKHMPATIRSWRDNATIYDDAYSLYNIFKKLDIKGIEQNQEFKLIQSKIGRNEYVEYH